MAIKVGEKDLGLGNAKRIYIGDNLIESSQDTTITWNAGNFPNNFSVTNMVYGNGRFLGTSSGNDLIISSDGINWEVIKPAIFGGADITRVGYVQGKFVAFEYTRHKVFFSEDGQNWTETESLSLIGDEYISTVSTANNRLFVSASVPSSSTILTDKVWYSDDGVVFYQGSSGNKNRGVYWTPVVYGNNKFIRFQSSEHIYAKSDDGEYWDAEQTPSPIGLYGFHTLVYGNQRFVCAGAYGQPKIIYSNDGDNWNQIIGKDFPSAYIYALTFINGLFIMQLGNNYFGYSKDGLNWSFKQDAPFIANQIITANDRLLMFRGNQFTLSSQINKEKNINA